MTNRQRFADFYFKTFLGSEKDEYGALYRRDIYEHEINGLINEVQLKFGCITEILGEAGMKELETLILVDTLGIIPSKYITSDKLQKVTYAFMFFIISDIKMEGE